MRICIFCEGYLGFNGSGKHDGEGLCSVGGSFSFIQQIDIVFMIAPIFVMMPVLIFTFCTSIDHSSTWTAPLSHHVIQKSIQMK